MSNSISKTTRYEVLRRDNYACRYCGAKAPFVTLHIDHVIPASYGGSNDPSNLTAACADCNTAKSNGIPHETVITEVRDDQFTYIRSRGGNIKPCMHCGKPVKFEEDDVDDSPQCEQCNELVCDAYEAGYHKALQNLGVK